MHIAIVAGEQSGDLLGAPLMQALKKFFPDAVFSGIGGSSMRQAGLHSLGEMDVLSVMGLLEVIPKLPSILRLKRNIIQYWKKDKPDLFIGIDSPDFNLNIARILHQQGVKTVHYVSPSLWAWKQKRIEKIKPNIDLMLCLFPFECDVYQQNHVAVCCVGHAMRDRLHIYTKAQAEQMLDLPPAKRLGIFPGSRKGEVIRLLPIYLEAYTQLKEQCPHLECIVSCANDTLFPIVDRMCQAYHLQATRHPSELVMAACDTLLLTSGTVTLEAALIKRPMVVGYRVHWLTAKIAKRLLKIEHFSLPNLLVQREIVPECIQEQCTPHHLASTLYPFLNHSAARTEQYHQLMQIGAMLPHGVSERAANAVAALFNERVDV